MPNGMRIKGDPLTYYVQRFTDYEWETVSNSPKRQLAIQEAKRLSLLDQDPYRVVVILTQFQTGA